ncbi:NAD-dependent epimerase/dehydratase family protein [Undibacterium sp. CY18W]|uniref:NAD-dependent epimerase/dehydratase family protein n=1 Tax=Undibacterium hunanense TaxID=2762292 RepID=A0ABR6ZL09_9BURK|nr:NAD-dependent epimerase/dehydratase family protein [Undibacterium hunanense]MBC3916585.1 NAD-dependent epimerase/dehydratase family protein [Undibacterium hunanense]
MNLNTPSTLPERPSVLVLGARGRFGHAAVQAFAAAGWRVIAQARSPMADLAAKDVEYLQCDALDTARILAAVPRVDVVIHAINPDYTRWETLLPPVTDAVIRIAMASGALLMVPGNVYNFGKELPAVLSENTPFAANTPKAAQRIAMEQSLADASRKGLRCVVVRAGDFIGGSGTWLDMAITKSLDKGVVTHMGPDDLPHAWAYLPDLANVFVRLAGQRDALPAFDIIHYPGITATGRDVHAALEQLSGRKLRAKAMPWWLMNCIALFSPMLKAAIKMRYLWQRPHQLSGDKLEKLLGKLTGSSLQEALRPYVKNAQDVGTISVA